MAFIITSDLPEEETNTTTTTSKISNKEEKLKALSAFSDDPHEFDFRAYSMNTLGLYSAARELGLKYQVQFHNALYRVVAKQVKNKNFDPNQPISETNSPFVFPMTPSFDAEGKMTMVMDTGKNKSIRYLAKNFFDMGFTDKTLILSALKIQNGKVVAKKRSRKSA